MRPDLTNIKNIIFDLGNVLLNLNFDASIKAFHKLGLNQNVLDRQQAYSDPVFYGLEIGEVSPENFRERVRDILDNPDVTDQQIDDAWYAMILDIPPTRVKILKELSKNFSIYLFSNTNKIHIERLHSDFKSIYGFNFSTLFLKNFYSHEIHARKPDLDSFKKVIKLSCVNPKETLFVDDLEKNILSAQKAGLNTFWLKEGMEMAELFELYTISES